MCGHKDTVNFQDYKNCYIFVSIEIKLLVCPGTKPHTNKGERMNKLPERIRIKDIARLANVSVGTVDRVLHGRSGVSEASRKRVEEILKQLDYQLICMPAHWLPIRNILLPRTAIPNI